MDRDILLVKNDNKYFNLPFRSAFTDIFGVHYYEVSPLSNGEMRFGWATREAKLDHENKIGDDKHSIGLELRISESNKYDLIYIYHKHDEINDNNKATIVEIPTFSIIESSNVIGCLIDVSNSQFQFYINGQQVQLPENVHFSTWPYYATVSLGIRQECKLNFGQTPFRYPPRYTRFNDINTINVHKCQLTKTVENYSYFWFAHPVIDNQVTLYYSDPKQVECDELVRKLEQIKHNQTTRPDHSVECGRLFQSVIEVVERRLACDNTDPVTIWVREVIDGIEKKSNFDKAKLLELLYPYHQLTITSSNSIKCQNISTIFILLLCGSGNFFSNNQVLENFNKLDMFLSKCSIGAFKLFLNSKLFITDPLKIIGTFNRLEHPPLPLTTQALLDDPSIMSTLNWCCELFGHVSSASQLYEPTYDFVSFQVGMCARWFRDDHEMQAGERHFKFPSQLTLNPADKAEQIKLSSDCLYARGGYDGDGFNRYQSVRSVRSVNSGIFYYEVVLITDGWMRFGWATKQSDLSRSVISRDEYSIGFDGIDGLANYPPKPQWSVGDVVGCFIDCDKKIFQFYLNGMLMKCREKIEHKYYLLLPAVSYYAFVSLYPHQQCYLNLGQCTFRYYPRATLRTLHHNSPTPTSPALYLPRLSECYSLVEVLAKDRIELLFDDDKQIESDQLADKFIKNISNSSTLPVNLKTQLDILRQLQSILSVSGPELLDSCLSVYASWISQLITKSTSGNPAFPDKAIQLLYPYFTLHLNNETVIKHRNVCIVLFLLISSMDNFKERTNLHQQVHTYITNIISSCYQLTDEFLMKFSFIASENLDSGEEVRKKSYSESKFYNTFESKRNSDLNEFSIKQGLSSICELVLLSQLTLDQFCNSNQINGETINLSNNSIHFKLSKLLLKYLTEFVFNSDASSKEIHLMIVLIVLGNIVLDDEDRKELSSNANFCAIINSKRNINLSDPSIIGINPYQSRMHQLVLLSQWAFDNLVQSNQTDKHQLYNHEILDSSKCSAHLKLSSDRLSARSDRNWQSVCSITSLNSKKYFFEVTLVTSGPMRIGWAAENVDLNESALGNDKYSIAFDGHNRCIWHNGKQLPVNSGPRWTVGDVVGCMVLISEKRFKFYLNQQSIKLPLFSEQPHFSSVKSYYAAASLFTFQQCQFNFSAKTKVSPKRTSFRVIDSARNSFRKGRVHLIHQSLHAVNSIVANNGYVNTGNVELKLTYPNHTLDENSFINSTADGDILKSISSRKPNINPHNLEENFNEQKENEEN